jgi:hypothetical protein
VYVNNISHSVNYGKGDFWGDFLQMEEKEITLTLHELLENIKKVETCTKLFYKANITLISKYGKDTISRKIKVKT